MKPVYILVAEQIALDKEQFVNIRRFSGSMFV